MEVKTIDMRLEEIANRQFKERLSTVISMLHDILRVQFPMITYSRDRDDILVGIGNKGTAYTNEAIQKVFLKDVYRELLKEVDK